MGFAFWFRFLNIALSVFVIVLCITKVFINETDKARVFRIIGLGLLSIYVCWISYDLLHTDFHTRILFATAGLVFAALGLTSMSDQPEVFKNRKK